MYKTGKKLLYTTIICSALALGGLNLAQAMESKTPIDRKAIKTEAITKTLDESIIIKNFDYGQKPNTEDFVINPNGFYGQKSFFYLPWLF